MPGSYADPNATITREYYDQAGGAATTEYAKFRHFQAFRLKAVHAAVITAGTNAGHGLGIYHGTTSIGSISLGTSTAGVVAHSATLNRDVATMDQISVKTLVDATGIAAVVYEFDVSPDAVETA